jgi:hypothetical protein
MHYHLIYHTCPFRQEPFTRRRSSSLTFPQGSSELRNQPFHGHGSCPGPLGGGHMVLCKSGESTASSNHPLNLSMMRNHFSSSATEYNDDSILPYQDLWYHLHYQLLPCFSINGTIALTTVTHSGRSSHEDEISSVTLRVTPKVCQKASNTSNPGLQDETSYIHSTTSCWPSHPLTP